MLYAKEFPTSKGILTFSIYLQYFISLQVEKNFTQFTAELKKLFITMAASFRFYERACIILANEK